MYTNYMTAYFIAVFISFIVWLLLFLISKNNRKEMLVIGSILAPFVILDILTTPSYWTPETAFHLPIGIEGFLFTFFITGTASVLYEIIFRKRYKTGKLHISFLLWFIIPAFITCLALITFKLNIIYLFIFGFTLMAITEVIRRRDLLINSLFSSLLFTIIYFFSFSLWLYISPESIKWWNMENLSNILIGIVPMEELLFSLSLGLFVGPFYEYLTQAKLFNDKNYKRHKIDGKKNSKRD